MPPLPNSLLANPNIPSPLPLFLPLTLTHHHTKRYYTTDSYNIPGIFLGIFIPIFFIIACCCCANRSKNKDKERKKRELEETIHRSIRLHSEICREEGGGCARGGGSGELSDSVVAEIVRDVQRELERQRVQSGVDQGASVGGQGESPGAERQEGQAPAVEEPPVYKLRG